MSNGKGSKRRPTDEAKYAKNHAAINWRRVACKTCGATDNTLVAINNRVLYKCRACGATSE